MTDRALSQLAGIGVVKGPFLFLTDSQAPPALQTHLIDFFSFLLTPHPGKGLCCSQFILGLTNNLLPILNTFIASVFVPLRLYNHICDIN